MLRRLELAGIVKCDETESLSDESDEEAFLQWTFSIQTFTLKHVETANNSIKIAKLNKQIFELQPSKIYHWKGLDKLSR